jgi:hypothetical protein
MKTDKADRLRAVERYCELLELAQSKLQETADDAGRQMTWEEFVRLYREAHDLVGNWTPRTGRRLFRPMGVHSTFARLDCARSRCKSRGMKRRAPKVVQMPVPQVEPLTKTDWERIARETFAERKRDVRRVPERRRAPIPTWRPVTNTDPS